MRKMLRLDTIWQISILKSWEKGQRNWQQKEGQENINIRRLSSVRINIIHF